MLLTGVVDAQIQTNTKICLLPQWNDPTLWKSGDTEADFDTEDLEISFHDCKNYEILQLL